MVYDDDLFGDLLDMEDEFVRDGEERGREAGKQKGFADVKWASFFLFSCTHSTHTRARTTTHFYIHTTPRAESQGWRKAQSLRKRLDFITVG